MTLELISVVSLLHLIGTFIGVGYCTLSEIFYIKASSDGVIDKHERKYLRRLFRGLHIALPIVLCTSIAVIVLQYFVPDAPQGVLSASFWAAQTILFIIVLSGYSLQKRQTPWWIASSAILMGWWMLACIDLGYLNSFGYIAILMMYLLLTFFAAAIVGYIRLWLWHPKMTHN